MRKNKLIERTAARLLEIRVRRYSAKPFRSPAVSVSAEVVKAVAIAASDLNCNLVFELYSAF